jgi:hypothetical protein
VDLQVTVISRSPGETEKIGPVLGTAVCPSEAPAAKVPAFRAGRPGSPDGSGTGLITRKAVVATLMIAPSAISSHPSREARHMRALLNVFEHRHTSSPAGGYQGGVRSERTANDGSQR